MDNEMLLTLIDQWKKDAERPDNQKSTENIDEMIRNAVNDGIRQGKRECADMLQTLIQFLG